MVYGIALLLGAGLLFGADPQQVALALRAQTDFDRVELAAAPTLRDAAACVQSQASVLPVTAPESVPLIQYRRGFCALTGALITRDRQDFENAARYFGEAIAAWPGRLRDRNAPAEPVSAGLSALLAISRLEAGPDAKALPELERQLDEARRSGYCPEGVMPMARCRQVLEKAGSWAGWIAVRQDRSARAELMFGASPAPGWNDWLAGRRAFENRRYKDSAEAYRRALDAWTAAGKDRVTTIPAGLNPPGDAAVAEVDLAEALTAAGDGRAAIPVLDAAARRPSPRPWVYFLRARAREQAGEPPAAALADYQMAARVALARGDEDSGEARFYRAIVLYRRGELAQAEDQFNGALNAGVAGPAGRDAAAWRSLAAVAAGACDTTRDTLARATGTASPFFPSEEAFKVMNACSMRPRQVSAAAR